MPSLPWSAQLGDDAVNTETENTMRTPLKPTPGTMLDFGSLSDGTVP